MSNKQEASRGKYLLKNTVVFAIGNFGSKLISFFLVPLYTYALTTQQYGTVDIIATIALIAVPLLSSNIAEGVMRFALDKDADHAKITTIALLTTIVATILAAATIPIWLCVPALSEYAVYTFLYIASSMASQMFLCNLRGRELLLQYSLGNILNTFLSAAGNVLFLVVLDWGIKGYLLAYILSHTVTAVYALLQKPVRQQFRKLSLDLKLTGEMAKYSIVLVPTALMWWIMGSLDKVMLSSICGLAVAGIYAVSYKLPSILSTIATIFNHAWSYSAIREEESQDRDAYSNTIYNGLMAGSLVVGTGLLLVLRDFMKIYVAEEYYTAWLYAPPLVISVVFATIGGFVATPYTVHKDSVGFLKSGLLGAGVNVIFNFALIPVWGAMGAAIATCIGYLGSGIYRIFDTRKYVKLKVLQGSHIIGGVLLLGATFAVYLDGISSRLIPAVALIGQLYLFRDIWIGIIRNIFKKARGRQCKTDENR